MVYPQAYMDTGLKGGSALFILPRWCFLSGCPTCIVCVSVFTVGKSYTVEIQSPPPESADLTAVLLSYLLDVYSSPGKHIHELRVLTALLITMPKAEISIVSPCVHFGWVCNEEENNQQGSLIIASTCTMM